MSYLIIDTETSGLFDFSKPADAPGQPRLCAVTFILADEDLQAVQVSNTLIRPNGWTISPEITAINGLTTERCEAEGVDVDVVLASYTQLIKEEQRIVIAFNAQFDTKVMRAELRLAGMPDLFEETPNICTMRACRGLDIIKANGKRGQPTLSDAYLHFAGEPMKETHNSETDAVACLLIAQHMKKAGMLPEAAVHYAKNRPEPI